MAFMNCRLHSKELKKEVEINVILPVESKAPERVLYLLHGLAGDASSWMRRTSIERYATARNIAVIMPDGGRWFYTDAVRGPRLWSYVAEELPEDTRYPNDEAKYEAFLYAPRDIVRPGETLPVKAKAPAWRTSGSASTPKKAPSGLWSSGRSSAASPGWPRTATISSFWPRTR